MPAQVASRDFHYKIEGGGKGENILLPQNLWFISNNL